MTLPFPSYGLGIGFNAPGKPEGRLGKQGYAHQDIIGGESLKPNVWSHLALTYDGARLRLYVDGTPVATEAVEKASSGGAGPLMIGCARLNGYHFKGRLDEIRIYNRALTDGEVGADQSAPIKAPKTPGAPANGVYQTPVASYPFDEGEGLIAADSTGDENEGTLSTQGVKWAPGKYGTGLKFEGSQGCVTIPDSEALRLGEEFTLESWVKPEGELFHDPAIYKESTEGFPSYALGIGFDSARKPEGQLGKAGKSHQDLAALASLQAGVWSHLALTYDGAKLRLYVNGELAATKVVKEPSSATPGPLTIGCAKLTGSYFKGRIDEVRIYDRALGAGEVNIDQGVAIQTPAAAPIAAYPFDEGAGTVVGDSSGNEDEGTLSAEGVEWASGKYGSGLKFDGSEGCVSVPDSEALRLGEEFTLESWVRPEGTMLHYPAIYKEAAGEGFPSYSLGIGYVTAGRPEGQLGKEGKTHQDVADTASLEAGVWSNLALTYDGVKLRLYVNGELTTVKPVEKTDSGRPGPLTIGCAALTGYHFKGRIDELRIYNRALGLGEVAADQMTPIQTPQSNPVADYPFDEGTGTVAHDASGNPNPHEGTLSGEGVKWAAAGKYGSGLKFEGGGGCVSIPDATELQLGEEFTLESWVRPEGELSQAPAIFKESTEGSPSYGLGIGFDTPGKPEGQIGKAGNAHQDIAAGASLEPEVWSHLALTYDGAKLRLYVNGTLETTKYALAPISQGSGPLTIGCGGSGHFEGRVDEVRIYNRALDGGEVAIDGGVAIQTPAAAPIAAYPFDENTGTLAGDSSGNKHEGTLSGEGVEWAPGKYGSSLQFDGAKGCVSIPDSTDLQLREEFTLESWVKPEGAMLHYPAIYKESSEGFPSYSLGIGFNTAGKPEGQLGKEGKGHQDLAANASLEPEVWSHLALTYDGAKLRLYVNGELVATKYVEKPKPETAGPLTIGCAALGAQHFKGRIDEVRIYNRAIGLGEVVADEGAPIQTPQQPPVAAYSLDEGEGTVAEDTSGNAHDGTLSAKGAEWAPGKYGLGLKLDGKEGCVTIPDSADLQLREEFTLGSWVRPEGQTSHYPAIYKESSEGFPSYSLGIGFNTAGKPEGQLGKEGKAHQDLAATASLEAGVWSHLALTYDGVTLRLYVNGELVATKYVEKPDSSSPGPLTIGCSALGAQHFKGRIDEVRIYNRSLSPAEIETMMFPLPRAKTTEAYGLDAEDAVFAGIINPMGEPTKYHFEYGLTSTFDHIYPEPPEELEEPVTGSEPREVELAIDTLQPDTNYYYRVVAENSRGTALGRVETLHTPKMATPSAQLKKEREKLGNESWLGRVGVNWSGNPQRTFREPNQMKLVGDSGAKLFRVVIGVDEKTGYPNDDQVFINAAKEHVTILPDIVGLPNREDKLIVSFKEHPITREEWALELHRLVNRYKPGGQFWTAHPELDSSYAPEYWEIWNEPNYSDQGEEDKFHRKGVIDPTIFGELLEVSHKAIKAADQDAKVVLGGLLTVGKYGADPEKKREFRNGKFVEVAHMGVGEFLKKAGHPEDYEILSLHPYAFRGNIRHKVKMNIQAARGALNLVGGTKWRATDENKRIWITELGWPVQDGNFAEEDGHHLLVSEDAQRQLLNSAFGLIKEYSGTNEQSFNIGRVLWYNIQDNYVGNERQNWAAHCGLVQDKAVEALANGKVIEIPGEEGRERSSWDAFRVQSGVVRKEREQREEEGK